MIPLSSTPQCSYPQRFVACTEPRTGGLGTSPALASSSAVGLLEVREQGMAIMHFMYKGMQKKIWAKIDLWDGWYLYRKFRYIWGSKHG